MIKTRKGASFRGLEWRDKDSWVPLRESYLLRKYPPFYGKWLGKNVRRTLGYRSFTIL